MKKRRFVLLLLLLFFVFYNCSYVYASAVLPENIWNEIIENDYYRKKCSGYRDNDANYIIQSNADGTKYVVYTYGYDEKLVIDSVTGKPILYKADGTVSGSMFSYITYDVATGKISSVSASMNNPIDTLFKNALGAGYNFVASSKEILDTKDRGFFSLKPVGYTTDFWYGTGAGGGTDGNDTEDDTSGLFDNIINTIVKKINEIVEAISELVISIVDGIKEALISLFVPKNGYFEEKFNELLQAFSKKFNIESYMTSLKSLNNASLTTINDVVVGSRYGTYSLDMSQLRNATTFIKPIITALYALIMLNFIFRKLYSIVRGEQF